MEEFSTYQEFFFHFEPVSQLPNLTVMSSLQGNEYINASSSPTNQCDSHPPPTQESIFHGQARGVLAAENNVNCSDLTAVNEEQQTNSLGPEFPQQQIPMNRKRKRTNGSCLTLAESKGGRENNRRNHKKRISTSKEKEKQAKIDKKNQKEVSEEPPTGYIHVRARRGQATDSHSLAERVRRFKISEKMKRLQGLVPGCDKITGKALVLDEIINYVQSLQHQIEFLSMKVASISPVPYDFDAALVEMAKSEKLNIQSTLASMQQSSQNLPTAILDAMMVANPTSTSYPLLDSSLAFLLQEERATSLSQDNSNLLWELEGQLQSSINPDGYSNIYPFQ